ncbi:MAG TPA: hypothetical protein VGM29_11310 [Polyangiaceae bacterium]
MTEKTREAHRASGFAEGVRSQRLDTIRSLQRIADSDDIEVALLEEIDRLTTVQAAEVSAAAGTQHDQAKQLAATIAGNHAGGGKDLVDTVADMMRADRGVLS